MKKRKQHQQNLTTFVKYNFKSIERLPLKREERKKDNSKKKGKTSFWRRTLWNALAPHPIITRSVQIVNLSAGVQIRLVNLSKDPEAMFCIPAEGLSGSHDMVVDTCDSPLRWTGHPSLLWLGKPEEQKIWVTWMTF